MAASCLLLLTAGAGVTLYVFDPAGNHYFPSCPFHALTGWHCPGCGTLRALHQLLHGHISQALALNPLAVVAAPFVGAGLIRELWSMFSGRTFVRSRILSVGWIWALLAVILAYCVLRNLPWFPFTLLAPHEA